jgi:UDP-2,3-diacylglucosamine pyrophosphatase LpxH
MSARLEKVYRNAKRLTIDKSSKIVCMSDCHRGVGNRGDNFLSNQNLFFAALRYYYDRCFTYIELGDGDELWENGNLSRIIEIHSDAFWMMSRFYRQGRMHMLYGNHDCRKKNTGYVANHYQKYYCDSTHQLENLFPGIKIEEGIVLVDRESCREILLLHGHQGDFLNDTLWPVAALLVKLVWAPLELLGVADPTSAARNYRKRIKTERRLERFSEKQNLLLIAGHTHRPTLPVPGQSMYINDGSCVHPRCITAIEIENGMISLVKWCTEVRRDGNLVVAREVLEGPVPRQIYYE